MLTYAVLLLLSPRGNLSIWFKRRGACGVLCHIDDARWLKLHVKTETGFGDYSEWMWLWEFLARHKRICWGEMMRITQQEIWRNDFRHYLLRNHESNKWRRVKSRRNDTRTLG